MADRIDTKELVSIVDSASGDFACAAEDFASLEAIFEAIVAATESHTLGHRLAKFGMNTAESMSTTYDQAKESMNANAARYARALRLVEREAS